MTKTTLSQIIDNLMSENWTYEINYTDYFNVCNAINVLAIFTTLLSLCKS